MTDRFVSSPIHRNWMNRRLRQQLRGKTSPVRRRIGRRVDFAARPADYARYVIRLKRRGLS